MPRSEAARAPVVLTTEGCGWVASGLGWVGLGWLEVSRGAAGVEAGVR